jgi:predicted nucleic acid-binding protein
VSAFFDTNILIYAQQAGPKAEIARGVLANGGTISVQVLNEFTAVSRRKLDKSWAEIDEAIDDILALVEPVQPITVETHQAARKLARDHGFSFYDALIIAAAISSGCDTLFSEDLHNGQTVGGLKIANPFSN